MPRRCCAGACGASPGAHLTERHEQAGALYRRHRIADQLDGFYRPAAAEYRAARRQVVLLNGVLLMLAAVSGVLAGADVDPDGLWSVLAIAFPAVATARRRLRRGLRLRPRRAPLPGCDRLARQSRAARGRGPRRPAHLRRGRRGDHAPRAGSVGTADERHRARPARAGAIEGGVRLSRPGRARGGAAGRPRARPWRRPPRCRR